MLLHHRLVDRGQFVRDLLLDVLLVALDLLLLVVRFVLRALIFGLERLDSRLESGVGLSAVQRVKTVKGKKRCYYVSSKGRTSKHRASCNRPKYPLRAKGTTKWSLTVKHLKRGHYQVYFRATDKAGNNERRRHKGRHFTVR